MLHWDVNNGISRRSWARNEGAMFAIRRAMDICPELKVTMPNLVDDDVLEGLFWMLECLNAWLFEWITVLFYDNHSNNQAIIKNQWITMDQMTITLDPLQQQQMERYCALSGISKDKAMNEM